ncbi:hypothetical protein BLA60_37305 [Actinophytocola xinjiangensis]|uniref:Galactose mutarotase-like enzyme n=1 Tax=Actinophytocola xinjiangensis TaxID=485602 RepID=A0A7Z1AUJ9_9PSEU|nr:DUF4432 family protein [Actinophytocola xinjiangensis]OLF05178.1 hypothetical protein BLA60_37305 [Actinophytocola xinjiangensis]
MIRLDNGAIAVEVAPGRGAEIRFLGRPGGDNVLYYEPSDVPLPAGRSVSYGRDDLDWLSAYRGGWQELFPNAGAACEVAGVPLAFHGEVSAAEWSVVDSGRGFAVLDCAARLPLVLRRRMTLEDRRPVLVIEETVTNVAGFPVDFLWGHHPAFEARPGARLDLPDAATHVPADHDPEFNDLRAGSARWPFAPGKDGADVDLRAVPDTPTERVVYLTGLARGWAALRDVERGTGVALGWDTAVFPHAWLWTEIGGRDFPWYGRSRIVALEPASAWPNDGLAAAIARGQGHRLGPHGALSTRLTVTLFAADERPVSAVDADGGVRT